MTDREKIIQGLAACIPETEEDAKLGCANCPYGCCKADAVSLPIQMIEDIRAVLKAQEAVKPYTKRDGRTTFFLCGGCNKPLCIAKDSYKPKHCPECGREVKWE